MLPPPPVAAGVLGDAEAESADDAFLAPAVLEAAAVAAGKRVGDRAASWVGKWLTPTGC